MGGSLAQATNTARIILMETSRAECTTQIKKTGGKHGQSERGIVKKEWRGGGLSCFWSELDF